MRQKLFFFFRFLSCVVLILCGCYMHEKDHGQYALCDLDEYLKERLNMLVYHSSGAV